MSSERILVPLAEGFEEIEAVTIVDVLRRAELDVTTAGLEPGPVKGSHGIPIVPDAHLGEEAAMPYEPGPEEGDPLLLRAFERAVLGREGVVGVGFGNDATGADALVVYLRTDDAAAGLPRAFEGYPVVTRTVGDVDAQ